MKTAKEILGKWDNEFSAKDWEERSLAAMEEYAEQSQLNKQDEKDILILHLTSENINLRKSIKGLEEGVSKDVGEWQLCPKCLGKGYHYPDISGTATSELCSVCNGSKIIAKPVLQSTPIVEGEQPQDGEIILADTKVLVNKINFYRAQTDKVRKYLFDNNIGMPNQPLWDAIFDHIQELKSLQEDKIQKAILWCDEKMEQNISGNYDSKIYGCLEGFKRYLQSLNQLKQ